MDLFLQNFFDNLQKTLWHLQERKGIWQNLIDPLRTSENLGELNRTLTGLAEHSKTRERAFGNL